VVRAMMMQKGFSLFGLTSQLSTHFFIGLLDSTKFLFTLYKLVPTETKVCYHNQFKNINNKYLITLQEYTHVAVFVSSLWHFTEFPLVGRMSKVVLGNYFLPYVENMCKKYRFGSLIILVHIPQIWTEMHMENLDYIPKHIWMGSTIKFSLKTILMLADQMLLLPHNGHILTTINFFKIV
ncbi:hypothetical protein ACJX0J_013388, partial [Zea mays]